LNRLRLTILLVSNSPSHFREERGGQLNSPIVANVDKPDAGAFEQVGRECHDVIVADVYGVGKHAGERPARERADAAARKVAAEAGARY
jgi:hypothetical protein